MVIDTERVRRHIRAVLLTLPLLGPPLHGCEAGAESAMPTAQVIEPAPATESVSPMVPLSEAELHPPTPPPTPTVAEPPENPARHAGEIRHAENRKRPRAVRGRPLRIDGRDIVAVLREVEVPPVARALGTELPGSTRARIAAAWLEDARDEHASVASFERAELELSRFGAPPHLLAAMRTAAADELAHTRLCLAMARRYGAGALAPGPLDTPPARGGTLPSLAADVFEEACVNETFAATVAASGANAAEVDDVRALLGRIAEDESAHAALAWATLRWAVVTDERVRAAVVARAATLRPETLRPATLRPETLRLETNASAPSPLGPLSAHGRLEGRDLDQAYVRTWSELIDPLLHETLSDGSRA